MSKTFSGARQLEAPSSAARWLAIALIVWLAGAAAGFATMRKHPDVPTWTPKPPAHQPVDIESPLMLAHNPPAVA